jgi:hypothetical protein
MKINWGWKIIIAYTIFIGGTTAWVVYAMTHDVDLVRADYYEHSLLQDQTMASQNRADQLRSFASISFDQAKNAFVVQIPKEQAASASGTITLYRPNASNEDRLIPLKVESNGTMIIPSAQLSKGIWQITADWSFAGKTYQLLATETI